MAKSFIFFVLFFRSCLLKFLSSYHRKSLESFRLYRSLGISKVKFIPKHTGLLLKLVLGYIGVGYRGKFSLGGGPRGGVTTL